MILEQGKNVLLVHRRLFPKDIPRFFVGRVIDYDGGIAKVQGYSWVRDSFSGQFLRKEDVRVKIFSLVSGTLIVYQLPDEIINIEELAFDYGGAGKLFLRFGEQTLMDLSESVAHEAGLA